MNKEDNFFERAYDIARKIPYGRVTSYGAIANYLGAKKSARMVGWAMNASSKDETVPAHRVVNRLGVLTGKFHFNGINLMQQLLEEEGIKIHESKIVDFKSVFWDPSQEI